MKYFSLGMLAACIFASQTLHAEDALLPWGSASEINQLYSKQKVVFDTTYGSLEHLTSILDRARYSEGAAS